MAYVTLNYYRDIYKGESVSDENFPPLCRRAEGIIEEMTLYRVTPVTFLAMTEDIQSRIQNAVCAQIEYLDANGGPELDHGANFQSGSLGKFSFGRSAGMSGSTNQPICAPEAFRYLAPTGLLYRGR